MGRNDGIYGRGLVESKFAVDFVNGDGCGPHGDDSGDHDCVEARALTMRDVK